MKNPAHILLFLFVIFAQNLAGAEESSQSLMIVPPKGWMQTSSPPEGVQHFFVPKDHKQLLPAISVAQEPFAGTLNDYLEIIKELNRTYGSEWKDLGMTNTAAGRANLSQTDLETEKGKVQLLHLILLREGTIYVLTAMALKEEFPRFYKEFFEALRSIHMMNEETRLSGYRVESYPNGLPA